MTIEQEELMSRMSVAAASIDLSTVCGPTVTPEAPPAEPVAPPVREPVRRETPSEPFREPNPDELPERKPCVDPDRDVPACGIRRGAV